MPNATLLTHSSSPYDPRQVHKRQPKRPRRTLFAPRHSIPAISRRPFRHVLRPFPVRGALKERPQKSAIYEDDFFLSKCALANAPAWQLRPRGPRRAIAIAHSDATTNQKPTPQRIDLSWQRPKSRDLAISPLDSQPGHPSPAIRSRGQSRKCRHPRTRPGSPSRPGTK